MQDTPRENKLRLLMILAAIYPEKLDGEKGLNLMKVGLFHCIKKDFYFLCICVRSVIVSIVNPVIMFVFIFPFYLLIF